MLRTVVFTSILVACGGSEQKPAKSSGGETVAANSYKEEAAPATSAQHEAPSDPTQPYMTKVGDPQPDSSAKPAGKPASSGASSSGNRVSQAECDQMFDKLIDLEIASNPQLKGAGPDVVALAKQMARDRGGAPPCTATPKEYSCAMAATSTTAWKRCVK